MGKAAAAVELGGEGADRRREPGSRMRWRVRSRGGTDCIATSCTPGARRCAGGGRSGGAGGAAPLDFVPVVVTDQAVCPGGAIEIEVIGRARVRVSARGRSSAAGGGAADAEGARMIVPPAGVRVLVATRPVDFRKGRRRSRGAGADECCGTTRSPGRSTCSAPSAPTG